MDKLGPLARTAEDCGLVLAAVAGADPEDPTALTGRLKLPARTPARRYRIGVLRGTLDRTQPEVRRNFRDLARLPRDFTDIAEGLVLPDFPYDRMAGLVLNAEAGEHLRAGGAERRRARRRPRRRRPQRPRGPDRSVCAAGPGPGLSRARCGFGERPPRRWTAF